MSLQEYFQTEDPEFSAIVAHGDALRGHAVTIRANGRNGIFETHVEPLRFPDGAFEGQLALARDVNRTNQARGGP